MATRKLKVICLHLVDGTMIIGKKKNEYTDKIMIEQPLVLSRYKVSFEADELQIILTKYDNFNSSKDQTISFNTGAIITSYFVDTKMTQFYTEFLEAYYEDDEIEVVEDTPKLLTEAAPKTTTAITPIKAGQSKVDFDKIRKSTIRVVVNNDESED